MRLFIYCLLKKGFSELELGGSFQETMVFSNVKIAHRALQHSQKWTLTEKRDCARSPEKIGKTIYIPSPAPLVG